MYELSTYHNNELNNEISIPYSYIILFIVNTIVFYGGTLIVCNLKILINVHKKKIKKIH